MTRCENAVGLVPAARAFACLRLAATASTASSWPVEIISSSAATTALELRQPPADVLLGDLGCVQRSAAPSLVHTQVTEEAEEERQAAGRRGPQQDAFAFDGRYRHVDRSTSA